jgi:S-DNA-T family DNA segregation ATPase FtsK/SpoIIIE
VAVKKTRRKQAAKRKKSGARKQNQSSGRLRGEVTGLLVFVLGIIMMLSIYFKGAAGPLGELIGKATGGLFGLMGYAIPVMTVVYGLISILRPRRANRKRKLLLALVLVSLISAILQAGLHDTAHYLNKTIPQYIGSFFDEGLRAIGKGGSEAGFLASGGVLGGIIGVPLLFVFKRLGSMIVLIVLAIISAMVLTRLSLADAVRGVYKGTAGAISGMVSAARKKREERALMRNLSDMDEDEEAELELPVEKPRRRAKILDFPIGDVKPEEHAATQTTPPARPADNGPVIGNPPPENPETLDLLTVKTPPVRKQAGQAGARRQSEAIQEEIHMDSGNEKPGTYVFPPPELLKRFSENESNLKHIRSSAVENARKLEATLESFGVNAKVINVSVGPAFTRFELQPAPGIKVSRIVNLTDDIALNLASAGVRIEAPIPGKAAIGIEIPNKEVAPIGLRSVLESKEFTQHESKLAVALGKDISGENVIIDIAKMPHILIAGATGSGKSVCINSIIISLLYKASPEDVKLLMIDPKVVELGVYSGVPHLLIPVVTDPNKAAGALRWAVSEMTTRYKLFGERGVRDLLGYNASVEEAGEGIKLPQIVIIIDELADLMMVSPHDVEDSICRLAQMARAAGMHLVIATQRPSVNVITGVIKANIPSRIAFSVSSQVDSRTILDMAGAEKLLGKGDMLYYPVGVPKPIRVKGAFVSDKEVELVVDFVKNQMQAKYDDDIMENINDSSPGDDGSDSSDIDEFLAQAIEAVIDSGQASVSFIQRKFKVGYARAGRIIDQMAERNIISGYEGSKPRRVLITRERWEEMKMSGMGDSL